MAKTKIENYNPSEKILEYIKSSDCKDPCLLGLWDMIGSSVTYVDDCERLPMNKVAVVEMFTKDPIAKRLMTEIIKFDPCAEKIVVHQLHDTDGVYYGYEHSLIQEKLNDSQSPHLVICAYSKFAVVLEESADGIELYFRDLQIGI